MESESSDDHGSEPHSYQSTCGSEAHSFQSTCGTGEIEDVVAISSSSPSSQLEASNQSDGSTSPIHQETTDHRYSNSSLVIPTSHSSYSNTASYGEIGPAIIAVTEYGPIVIPPPFNEIQYDGPICQATDHSVDSSALVISTSYSSYCSFAELPSSWDTKEADDKEPDQHSASAMIKGRKDDDTNDTEDLYDPDLENQPLLSNRRSRSSRRRVVLFAAIICVLVVALILAACTVPVVLYELKVFGNNDNCTDTSNVPQGINYQYH